MYADSIRLHQELADLERKLIEGLYVERKLLLCFLFLFQLL